MKFKLQSPPFLASRLHPGYMPKIPLRLVLTVPFVLETIGIVALVGYLSYWSGQRAVEDLASQLMQETSDRIVQNLDRYFQAPKTVVRENQAAIKLGILDWRNSSLMKTYFVQQLHINADVSGLMISTEDNDCLIVSRPRPDRLAIRKCNPATRALENYAANLQGKRLYLRNVQADFNPHAIPAANPWYRAAKRTKEGIWRLNVSTALGIDNPLLIFAYFLPFTDSQGKLQGVLSASIYLDQAGDFLRRRPISKTGQAFIMDKQGLLIATSTAEVPFRQNLSIAEKKALVPEAMRLAARNSQNPVTRAAANWSFKQMGSGDSQLRGFHLENKRYFGQIIPFKLDNQISWTIVVVVPESDFMEHIEANVYRTAIVCGLALLGAIGSGIWTSRRITRSLFDLTQATQDLTEGKLKEPLKPTRIREVQALSESLCQMTNSLRQAEQLRQNYEQDLERQVAEKTAFLNEAQRIAKIGIWSWNLVTNERWWSPQMYRILGLNPEEYRVPPDVEIANQNIHPEDRERVNQITKNAIEQGISYEIEFRFLRPGGGIIYVYSAGMVECNTQGRFTHFWGISQDISDRKVGEEALRQSETRLNEAQRVAHLGSWEFDLATQEVIWSEELYRIYEVEDLAPVPRPDLTIQRIHPDDEERFQREVMAAKVSRQCFDSDLRIITTKGNVRHIQAKGQPIYNAQGEVVKLAGTIADITDRKQLELALQASQAKLSEVLDSTIAGIIKLRFYPDRSIKYDYISPHCDRTFGYTVKELMSDANLWRSRIYPDDWRDVVFPFFQTILTQRGTGSYSIEYRFVRKDESICWILANCSVQWNAAGDYWSITVVDTDISDRKQAEISLKQALQELTYHVEHSPLATIHWNQEFRIQSWSKQAEEMFGWKAQEVQGKTMYDWQFIFEDDLEAVNQVTDQLLKGISCISHNRNYHKDGAVVYCEWYNSALIDENGKLISILSLALDVTDRTQAEAELAKAKEAAEAANRAKSEFLANMSHEIRTPMNAILGFSELLQGAIPDPKLRGYLNSIASSGRTLLDLINDILDLSKIEAGKLELQYEFVNVRSVIRDIKQILEIKAIQKGLFLLIEIDETVPNAILFDEVRLRQILFNTVGNAIKFTERGFVKISVKTQPVLFSQSNRVQMEITVTDTGIGISSDQQESIFQPFQQSEGQSTRKYGGTGLGLAITKRLTQLLGGTVTLQSEVGKGSAFTFIFPDLTIQEIEKPQIEMKKLDKDLAQLSPAIFLIVDDVQSNLDLIEGYFIGTQHRLLFARDGQEAIEVAQANCPDVILMDLWMPKLDGLQATKLLKQDERTKNIPIVIITAVSRTEEVAAVQALVEGFLGKPFSCSELVSLLKQILPLHPNYVPVNARKIISSQLNTRIKPDPQSLAKLPELVEKLRQEEESSWLQLSKTMKRSEIQAFIKRLRELGQEYQYQPLIAYTTTLENQLVAFDWEKLPQSIQKFSEVIYQLKEMV